jgi:hypothetical protein
MNESEKKGTLTGIIALFGLLLIATFPLIVQEQEGVVGAVVGDSYVYKMCLSKYGKDIYGEWQWDEIKDCREKVLEMEKGREAKSPRLYRSSDRSEYANEE